MMVVFKGLLVGGTMLIPGVSGGSMAMILGIYEPLLSSISSFHQDKKRNFIFLSLFTLGGILGLLLFATPLYHLMQTHRSLLFSFFMGAVAGGTPMLLHHAQIHHFQWKYLVFIGIGVLMIFLLELLPSPQIITQENFSSLVFIRLSIAGIASAIALVLPGISVSYVLLLLGLYDPLMLAIQQWDMMFLLPLAIGGLLGVVLTTKFLSYVLNEYPQPTYLMIFGFLLGSLYELLPTIPTGMEWLAMVCLFGSGFFCIYFLSKKEA